MRSVILRSYGIRRNLAIRSRESAYDKYDGNSIMLAVYL
jgi:hypothetical protein